MLSDISPDEIDSLQSIWNKEVRSLCDTNKKIDQILIGMEKTNLHLYKTILKNVARVGYINPDFANGLCIGTCFLYELVRRHEELSKLEV
jgi:hypothetical protein